MEILFNVVLGLLPTFALAWTIAADAKKASAEKVVETAVDARQQKKIFLLIHMLWALTLLMWNWMRDSHPAWMVVWGVAALTSGGLLLRARRTSSSSAER